VRLSDRCAILRSRVTVVTITRRSVTQIVLKYRTRVKNRDPFRFGQRAHFQYEMHQILETRRSHSEMPNSGHRAIQRGVRPITWREMAASRRLVGQQADDLSSLVLNLREHPRCRAAQQWETARIQCQHGGGSASCVQDLIHCVYIEIQEPTYDGLGRYCCRVTQALERGNLVRLPERRHLPME
jgi:hypothetical protein